MHQLLLTLHHMGSASFQRATGDVLQVSQYAANRAVDRVYDVILRLEPEFLYYPDAVQNAATE